MADGFVLNAEPYIPDSGLRSVVADQVRQNIRQLLIDALADKLGHAYAVASGKSHFREVFMRHMGAFWGNSRAQGDHIADVCFDFLSNAWREQYPQESAFRFLDTVHVESPETQAEFERQVADAWEVEIAGSDEAMAQHYHGSARVRKGKDIFSTFWTKDPSLRVN